MKKLWGEVETHFTKTQRAVQLAIAMTPPLLQKIKNNLQREQQLDKAISSPAVIVNPEFVGEIEGQDYENMEYDMRMWFDIKNQLILAYIKNLPQTANSYRWYDENSPEVTLAETAEDMYVIPDQLLRDTDTEFERLYPDKDLPMGKMWWSET